ncbi:MAG: tetratricopeptide repeat protein [Bryobacteraceae bacterium]
MKETRKPRRLRRAGGQGPGVGGRVGYPPLLRVGAAHPAWRRHAWRMLALWALVLAAYSNSFQAGLVFDSAMAITHDARIRAVTPRNLGLILTEQYWHSRTISGLYRPLTTASYLLNYAVFGNGTHPAGYHWVNLALHGVNVSLVYLLGILVLGAPAPALALAALWGLHPLLTESVTNVVGRADLLAAFGVLAGLLCYVKSASATGRRKLLWVAAMVAAQAVGIFSKENAVVLPGIMLLYDLTWRGRSAWRGRALAYSALVLPLAAFFCLRVAFPMHIPARFGDNPLITADFWTARLTALKVIGKYLWLFVWPARLSADYSYDAVPLFGWHPAEWEDAKALMALALCLGAALLAIRWYRTRKPLFFFLAFFFVALAPTSNLAILIGSIMAERFVYLPSIGLAGCAIAALCALGRPVSRQRLLAMRTAWIALGLLCLACAVRTYARNFDWLDDLSLWTSAVDVCPGSAKAHINLGSALSKLPGRLPDAIVEYRVALRIEPDYAEAHYNLGKALLQLPGRLPDAIAEYEAALRINPDFADVHFDLGNALFRLPGRLPDAIAEYEAALRINPDFAEVRSNLGNALLQLPGRLPDAIAQYEVALRMEPGNAVVHMNLGNALSRLPGRLPDAIAEYQAALRVEPGYAAAHFNLGYALSRLPGRLPDAIAEYQSALRIDPSYAEAHNNLGLALAHSGGRWQEAIAEYEAALRIDPNLAAAHDNLGVALADSGGRWQEAIAEYEAALRIDPDYAEAHFNLGNALSRLPGRLPDAIAQYEAALRIRPDPKLRQMVDRLRGGRK